MWSAGTKTSVQIFSVFHYTTDDGNSQYKLIVAYQAFIISESYGDYKMYLWWESKFTGGKSKSKLQMFSWSSFTGSVRVCWSSAKDWINKSIWAQCLMVFANTHYTVFWASEKRKTALNTCSVMAYINVKTQNIFHLSTTKSCSNKLFPVTFISLFISEKPRPSQS